MLTVSSLSKRHGDRSILDKVSFTINPDDRVGLVGANGAGKSTLLAILASEIEADGGGVALAPGRRVGHLRQGFADQPETTLGGLVGLVSPRLRRLLDTRDGLDEATSAMADPASDPERTLAAYDTALAAFEDHGGYAAVDELATIFAALGLDHVPFGTPLATLSGGQKTRTGLAALLADGPDLLLLDEPTNHLDIDALSWLERFLASYRGAVLAVSHDRVFLDRTVTTILELDEATHHLTSYPGTYSAYVAARGDAAAAHLAAYKRQQREIAEIERDVRAVAAHAQTTERSTQHDFLRARAKKVARSAKVRERKLERLIASEARIDKPERRWGLALEFGERIESSRDVVVVEGAEVDLGGRPILRDVHFHVRFGERIAVTGPNGGGKSTLLRLLARDLPPSRGHVLLGPGVTMGRYAQEQETVDPDQTVLDQARGVAALSETEARSFLHRYLFSGDIVFRRAGNLSYGERARLALALLVLGGVNFLLLDEPLNHLDLPSRERFEEALTRFGGTTVMVLHDRYAIDRLATRVLELRDGRLCEPPLERLIALSR